MQLSIVTPVYKSAPYLREFYQRIRSTAAKLTSDYEIILVNDGSLDGSLDMAISLHQADPRVRVIDLSRTFGQHKAMMTGLANTGGELVFLIDDQIEQASELLESFWEKLHQTDLDVVYGVQEGRGGLFYKALNLFSNYPIPAKAIAARLMRREYVRSLLQHGDRELFLAGLWALTGFRQLAFPVEKSHQGARRPNFRRRMSMLLDSITSFSSVPLLLIAYLGCAMLLLAGFGGLYLITRRLFFGVFLSGWLSVVTSIWFLGGLTIFCIGLIGIYVARIFMEVKARPCTVTRKLYEHGVPLAQDSQGEPVELLPVPAMNVPASVRKEGRPAVDLSVVTTLYRSEPFIREFHRRISEAAAKISSDFELIFVNDGSPDHSLQTVLDLAEQDPHIVAVDLSRNFGHHKAIMAGLGYARGKRVFLIDSDLEEDPELLLPFTAQLDNSGADVAFGVQAKRTGGVFRRLTGAVFYRFFALASDLRIPPNLLTVRLMSARYVRNLLLHTEREFALSGLWQLTGFQQVPVVVARKDRGSTTYSASRRFAMFVNTVSAFSNRPLTFSFFLGLAVMVLCGLGAGFLLVASLWGKHFLSGWASVVISIWSVGGLTLFSLGVIGKYLGTIFIESKKRPLTIVRAYYGFPNAPAEEEEVPTWMAAEGRR